MNNKKCIDGKKGNTQLYIPKTFEFQDYIENKGIDKKNTLQKLFIGM